MHYQRRVGDYIFESINYTVLGLLALCCIYPFMYVLFASFSNPLELIKHQGILYKSLGFTLKGYVKVFENPNIMIGYKNTLLYVVIGTTVNIILTSMGAYVLSRKKARLVRYMMVFIVFTMFFYGGLIPFYLLIQKIGLYNTRAAIILYAAVWSWNLIIMRTSFLQIPDSLEESARIDGANDFTILFCIIMPVSKATIAVMVLFYAVGRWNEWFMPLVLLRSREKYPLQLILREILIIHDTSSMTSTMVNPQEEDMYKQLLQYTVVIVSILPVLCLYPFLQKYFVKGILIGSIKG